MKPYWTLEVDRTSDEPVYEQIARQIRARIAAGGLTAGCTLPAVRILASDLGVNLNTVARAYRLLEEEGFVDIRDRSGVEVVPPATSPNAETRDRLREALQQILGRLRQAGLSPAELRNLVSRELDALTAARRPGGREEREGKGGRP